MALASAAIKSARVYLNDVNAITWTDSVLIPVLQEAFGEMLLEIGVHRLPVIKYQFTQLIPAISNSNSSPVIFPNLPTNIITPISMYEKSPYESNDFYEEMAKVTFLPLQDPDMELMFWCWIQQQIQFIGATQDRTVLLNYHATLTTPQVLTDPLGFIYAEQFLGPRIASIALSNVGQEKRAIYVNGIAQEKLYKVMQYNVTEDQRPVRKKRYRSAKAFGDFGGTVPVGTIIESATNWIPPNNAPDGITNIFTFAQPVRYMSLDGSLIFQGTGYTSLGNTQYQLSVVPASGAILMGETT